MPNAPPEKTPEPKPPPQPKKTPSPETPAPPSPAPLTPAPATPAPCADDPSYVDVHGYSCRDWVGYDCRRPPIPFTPEEQADLLAHCRDTCGECGHPGGTAVRHCTDDVSFLDANGFRCSDWARLDCTYAPPGLQYTSAELRDVSQHCRLACNVCGPAPAPLHPPGCADDPAFADAHGYGCAHWRDCTKSPQGFQYNAIQLAAVQEHCPLACGVCHVPASPSPLTPAPPSPAPESPSPWTPSPETPAPPPSCVCVCQQCNTCRPPTPAPVTPAPETPIPITMAPHTLAPVTPTPFTPTPNTPAPFTPAPHTPAPHTPAPHTPAPHTPAPPTPVPYTPAPHTPVPRTAVPATPAPQTPAPTPAPTSEWVCPAACVKVDPRCCDGTVTMHAVSKKGGFGTNVPKPTPVPAGFGYTPAPAGGIGCADDASFTDAQGLKCSDWASLAGQDCATAGRQAGYSAADLQAVLAHCKRTCHTCAAPPTPAPAPGPCRDDPAYKDPKYGYGCSDFKGSCDQLASLGFNSQQVAEVNAHCPVACGRCTPSTPAPSGPCEDDMQYVDPRGYHCHDWVEFHCGHPPDGAGYTSSELQQLLQHCPVTCGICKTPYPAATPSPTLPGQATSPAKCPKTPPCHPADGWPRHWLIQNPDGTMVSAKRPKKAALQEQEPYAGAGWERVGHGLTLPEVLRAECGPHGPGYCEQKAVDGACEQCRECSAEEAKLRSELRQGVQLYPREFRDCAALTADEVLRTELGGAPRGCVRSISPRVLAALPLSRLRSLARTAASEITSRHVGALAPALFAALAAAPEFERLSTRVCAGISADKAGMLSAPHAQRLLAAGSCAERLPPAALAAAQAAAVQRSPRGAAAAAWDCAAVSPQRAAELRPPELQQLRASCVATLPPAAVAALRPEQLRALGARAAEGLRAAQLAALGPAACGGLGGSEAYLYFPAELCAAMTAACAAAAAAAGAVCGAAAPARRTPPLRLQQLSPAAAQELGDCSGVDAVPPEAAPALSRSCVGTLRPAVFAAMAGDGTLRLLDPAHAPAVSEAQVAALRPSGCAALAAAPLWLHLTQRMCHGLSLDCLQMVPGGQRAVAARRCSSFAVSLATLPPGPPAPAQRAPAEQSALGWTPLLCGAGLVAAAAWSWGRRSRPIGAPQPRAGRHWAARDGPPAATAEEELEPCLRRAPRLDEPRPDDRP